MRKSKDVDTITLCHVIIDASRSCLFVYSWQWFLLNEYSYKVSAEREKLFKNFKIPPPSFWWGWNFNLHSLHASWTNEKTVLQYANLITNRMVIVLFKIACTLKPTQTIGQEDGQVKWYAEVIVANWLEVTIKTRSNNRMSSYMIIHSILPNTWK